MAEIIALSNQDLRSNQIHASNPVSYTHLDVYKRQPYEIKIIGDPDELEAALLKSGTYLSLVYRGMPIQYAKQDSLTISAYTGAYSTNYGTIETVLPGDIDEETNNDSSQE